MSLIFWQVTPGFSEVARPGLQGNRHLDAARGELEAVDALKLMGEVFQRGYIAWGKEDQQIDIYVGNA